MKSRLFAFLILSCLLIGVVAQQGGSASAQQAQYETLQLNDTIVSSEHDEYARVGVGWRLPAAPSSPAVQQSALTGAPTSTFIVNYSGFTPQAQAAFQAAVDIWASTLVSSVPIVINATYTALPWPVLGQGGPNLVNFGATAPTGAKPNTWYPFALANSLAGYDIFPSSADITVTFTSDSRANWYLGTDGNVPSGRTDFTSVVLHELGHGLGFISSFAYSGGQGSYGFGNSRNPDIYDGFVVNGSGTTLTGLTNGSSALGTQLVSNNVFLDGPGIRAANNNQRARVYAPSVWSNGSSLSHLDEVTYPPSSGNALMTPAIGMAEAEHSPGPIVTGFFKDIGWQVNSSGGGGGGGGGGTTEAYYLSVGSAATVGGLAIQGSDIVRYSNGAATLLFRGSNVGLSGTRLDGFQVLPNGQILMSFATAVTLPVLGAVDAADIVTFTPTGSGANTAGSFAMFFDASDVGLSGSAENTDAFFYDAVAKKLYLSTSGSFTVAGLSGTSRDILSCNNLQSGWTTRCNGGFSLVFRGSNIGLTTTSENVDAFSIGPNGTLYFSTAGNYSLTVGGLSGPGGDVFSCASPVLGSNSSCGSVAKLLSASTLGLGTTSVTGFQFAP